MTLFKDEGQSVLIPEDVLFEAETSDLNRLVFIWWWIDG